MLSDDLLLSYLKQGLIPGPEENEEAFEERAVFCLHIKEILNVDASFKWEEKADSYLKEAFSITKELYGIEPTWVPLIFSDEKLLPWHGGAALIFQMSEQSPISALLQLRKRLFYKQNYFGMIERKELIAHELSHIGRMLFDEPVFEELLAYRSSSSWISRNLGGLVESASESLLFVFVLLLIFLLDLLFLFYGSPLIFLKAFWLKLIPAGLIVYALVRLFVKKRIFYKCLENLKKIFGSKEKANAVVYCLTDHEIKEFAKMSALQIKEYIENEQSFRFQSLRLLILNL